MKIVEWIKERFSQIVSYIFWGVCTTLVNVLIYALLRLNQTFSVAFATAVAWACAVFFAFFTNRIFVFHSQKHKFIEIFNEMLMFFAMRLFSGLVDIGLMWFLMLGNTSATKEIIAKIFTNIVIIILNYFLSIFVVFAQKNTKNSPKTQNKIKNEIKCEIEEKK